MVDDFNDGYQARKKLMKLFLTTLFLLLFHLPAFGQERLTYQLQYSTAMSGRVHVVILPSKSMAGAVTFVMPRAIPSGYAQQFYDRYVENVQGTSRAGA